MVYSGIRDVSVRFGVLWENMSEQVDDYDNWASEANPFLGCSIEISRDIYIYMCVCVSVVCQINCVGGITWPTRMLKVILGGKNWPVTHLLLILTTR